MLQGGGALGAYQGGVYEAITRRGGKLDWVTGISIGAINAALIVGNPPELRVERLRTFWELVSTGFLPSPWFSQGDGQRSMFNEASAAMIATFGIAGFFKPRNFGPLLSAPGTPGALSFYDTAPLRQTLEALVDFDLINNGNMRLSVGAVNIATGNQIVFDNKKGSAKGRIGPQHIMASAALPPGFPPIEIEGESYWDGGIVSNTPLEFVLDEEVKDDLVIFQIDLFNASGQMPKNLIEASDREKEIRYSSRTRLNSNMNLRIHAIKTALRELMDSLPSGHDENNKLDLNLLREAASENSVTLVQLVYRKKPYEGGSKDYDFSRQTMVEHWAAGIEHVEQCLKQNEQLLSRPPKIGVTVLDPGLHV